MPTSIALVQFNPVRNNPETNTQMIQNLLAITKADLIVLPELANSGYMYANPKAVLPVAENQDGSGPFLSTLKMIARNAGGVIVTGYAELDEGTLYNSAAAVTSDGVIANYRKTHLYADEKNLFQPGDTGFTVFTWLGIKIGMMICFDWIFPEAARSLALAGAQIIAHPSNLVLPYCQDAMVTRSIENRLFTITANRIGSEQLAEKKLTFTGQSQMTSPNGEILFRATENETTVQVMHIAPEDSLNKWISEKNHLLDDRRETMYSL